MSKSRRRKAAREAREGEDMTVTWREILFFLILFGANLIQAITGFAGTLLAMPPSMKVAKEILDDMIEANKGYWPELK